MKKKQKGKLVLGLFMGCCLLYAMSGFSTKIRTGSSISPKRGRAVSAEGKLRTSHRREIQTKRELKMQKIQK